MRVDLLRVTTRDDLQDFWAIEVAAHEHDCTALPADPFEELLPLLDGEPRAGELVLPHLARQDGVPVATLTMTLPLLDNLQVVNLEGTVHPGHRKRGHGRTLLAAGRPRRGAAQRPHAGVLRGPGPVGHG